MVFNSWVSLTTSNDWSKIDKQEYLDAMIASHTDSSRIRELLRGALTDRIDDREIFMKGIDYSYYYEQEDWQEAPVPRLLTSTNDKGFSYYPEGELSTYENK